VAANHALWIVRPNKKILIVFFSKRQVGSSFFISHDGCQEAEIELKTHN
jgi:hypothetical protein